MLKGINLTVSHRFSGKDSFSLNMAQHIDFSLGIVGVFGQSGQGKSSMLKICSGITPSLNSKLEWIFEAENQVETLEFNSVEACPAVYQDQQVVLFEHLNVQQNLDFVVTHSIWRKQSANQLSPQQVAKWCDIEHLLTQSVGSLSGGEKQRLGFARSILSGKPLVILDEPFSALDWPNRVKMLRLVKMLQQQHKFNFILVSHSLRELAMVCDTLMSIEQGQIIQFGLISEQLERVMIQTHEPLFSRLDVNWVACLEQYHLTKWQLTGCDSHILFSKGLTDNNAVTFNTQVLVISADKVSLSLDLQSTTSMLNQLHGKVVSILPYAHLILVSVDVDGQKVYSLISKLSFEQMQIHLGQWLYVQFKAIEF